MKKLVFSILMLLAVIFGVGFYRGWFTVNQTRIQQDEETAKGGMHDLEQKVKDRTGDRNGPVKDTK